MRKLSIVALFATLSVILSSCCGCKAAKSSNPYTLTSNSWQLVELDQAKINAEGDSFTLTFDEAEGKIYGRGDCNSYFANYLKEPVHKLKFDNSGSTRMFCPNQEREDKYMSVLNSVDSFIIDGDMLLLSKSGEVKMIFKPLDKIIEK